MLVGRVSMDMIAVDVTATPGVAVGDKAILWGNCLLYTSDAADERSSVDLGGRRIIKKKKKEDSVGNNRKD